MSDFLLEIRCEEIPARMQAGARAELERLFGRELGAAGIDATDVTVWSTPRRLALIARGLPDATQAVSEEAKGPPEGAAEAALDGFCRKNGVTKEQLQLREVKGRQTWFAVIERPGRATKDVLAGAIPAVIRDFAWPKSMRWGEASLSTESPRWVRPLSGIVAILGEELVECEAAGIASGYATLGHRFHHPGPITIGGAHDYQEKLRACHVIVDHEERAALIREGAARAAAEAGLTLVEDEGLVVENAGLTEWPVPLLGRFDEAFLDVPPEVIQLTARVNQKYFVANDGAGKIANAFVCTANIAAADGGAAIVEGNRRVLAARLSDARFFWEQDRKTPLAEHAKKLERITFHEKLGTVADKVERVAKLARWLVGEGIVKPSPLQGRGLGEGASEASTSAGVPLSPTLSPEGERERLADLAEQAARLCKADLVTEMVGEFPELQGVMGGYYARAEGLDPQIADAIRDHYKPVGQGDEVPTAPVTVAVSLADKLDTLVGFFAVSEKPTGSKDPFALRRAAIALIRLLTTNKVRIPLRYAVLEARRLLLETTSDRVKLIPEIAWDEEWLELPLLETPLNPQLADGVIAVPGLREEDAQHDLEGRYVYSGTVREHRSTLFRISEALDLIDAVMVYLFDRAEEAERRGGVRLDLIRSVIPREYKYIDLDPFKDDGPPRKYGPLVYRYRVIDHNAPDDLVRLLARVKALQHYIETAEGADLLAAYKRAANILKKEGWGGLKNADNMPLNTQGIARTGEEDPLSLVDDPDMAAVVRAQLAERKNKEPSYTPEPAETALIAALDSAEPEATAAVEAEDFAAAMSALASLRAPIDRFFDEVTVNDPDPDKRAARLNLLARFRDAVHRVADFSRIEG